MHKTLPSNIIWLIPIYNFNTSTLLRYKQARSNKESIRLEIILFSEENPYIGQIALGAWLKRRCQCRSCMPNSPVQHVDHAEIG